MGDRYLSGRVELLQGDITTLEVDAIVNAANRGLLGGGGVDGAIHRAAGPELLAACRKLHGCEPGGARITEGFRLPARWVIHAVGPRWKGGQEDEAALLGSAYLQSLMRAEEVGAASVAFPAISTGSYGFPLGPATRIAMTDDPRLAGDSTTCPRGWSCACYRIATWRRTARSPTRCWGRAPSGGRPTLVRPRSAARGPGPGVDATRRDTLAGRAYASLGYGKRLYHGGLP